MCALEQNRILVIDIDPVIRSGICGFLRDHGFHVAEAANCRDAQTQLHRFRPSAVVLDLYLPNGDVPQLLRESKQMDPRVPVLLLAGQLRAGLALHAIPEGADEILRKPLDLTELHTVLARLLRRSKSPRSLGPSASETGREVLDPFLGTSPAIVRLGKISSRVVATQSPVLIQGETGTGKGVLARWIHENGPRARRPFLDLNCAGLSRELLESELFGHQKGAFTGAVYSKPGLLEVADGGTVFLDEIGDMELQVQSKLLKVLEERVFRRLGDVRDRAVDMRLISATHRELQESVCQQKFRSDLYFRVNIVLLKTPALRERVEDIAPLSQYLLRSITRHWGRPEMTIASSAMKALQSYAWPGNIRELRNVLERAVLVAESEVLGVEHLQFQTATPPGIFTAGAYGTLKQMERAYIHHILQAECGSIERAARRLGIPRSSLYNKMRRFEIPQGTGRLCSELAVGAAD